MKKRLTALLLLFILILSACASNTPPLSPSPSPTPPAEAPEPSPTPTPEPSPTPEPEPLTERRNFYEIFVGSFCDSNGDGLGDLPGVISKLDYLNNETGEDCLGVNAIWLMPIMPSPTYHKYDVTDYYGIDPGYGTLEDFDTLIEECDKRGIDVIIDLVLNHSSNAHPWFQAALKEIKDGAEPHYKDYYNFVEGNRGGYYSAGSGLFYEAGFWSGMPDLNMDNEELRAEVLNIAEFWINRGVKGFRLDAAKHVYTRQEKNIEFWTWFSSACKEMKEDVFLISEVWSNDNEIMAYYETGLSAMFNFSLAGAAGVVNSAVNRSNGDDLAGNIERFDKLIRSRNPEAINAPFLSNHDTDRSAEYIKELNQQKLEAAIYLMIPGSPFIYYGEEIGMTGKGKDENKRTGMLWSATDKTGYCAGPAGAVGVTPPEAGVAEQLADPDSLLNYYRAVLELKSGYQDIMDGEVSQIKLEDIRVCAIQTGEVAVVHNVSGEEVTVPLPGWTLGGFVSPGGGEVAQDGEQVTLPPYSSAVLQ
ncbi:MAG: alpha amylase [Oscillospiraceae bacterium]|jgi:glycosidase|nr:alpha amylase [Oscillospiraceae bacterium]